MMRLQDFMSRDVETIAGGENVEAAYQRMRLYQIRHLVVVDNNKVTGILSEREVNRIQEFERQGCLIKDIMESHVVTAEPGMTIREAANLMHGQTIGCLPVLENDKVVGIVTTTDLLDLQGQGIE